MPRLKEVIQDYFDHYVLRDASENPFSFPPYGVYKSPEYADFQTYRDAGRGFGVRSFIPLYQKDPIPHGTNSVVAHHAYALARAGYLLNRKDSQTAAEEMLQWLLGHNPFGACMITDLGFRHPTPAHFYLRKIPYGFTAGCVGRENDTPYQEMWDIPWVYVIGAATYLGKDRKILEATPHSG